MMYFRRVTPNVHASLISPSTSPNPETVIPTPLLPSPPQPTQYEDNEGENLYDDPLPYTQ